MLWGLFAARFVEQRVRLGGVHSEWREEEMDVPRGQGRQPEELFSASPADGDSVIAYEKRNVGADAGAELTQGIRGERFFGERIEDTQNGGCIGAAASQPTANRDSLFDDDLEAVGPARFFCIRLGGAIGKILLLGRVAHHTAAKGARQLANVNADIVAQCDSLKDGLDRMESVGLSGEDAQREIDLRLRQGSTAAQAHAAASVDACRSRRRTPSRVK